MYTLCYTFAYVLDIHMCFMTRMFREHIDLKLDFQESLTTTSAQASVFCPSAECGSNGFSKFKYTLPDKSYQYNYACARRGPTLGTSLHVHIPQHARQGRTQDYSLIKLTMLASSVQAVVACVQCIQLHQGFVLKGFSI